jgi:hypothetical protein
MTTKEIWAELNTVRRTKAKTPAERLDLMYRDRELVNLLNPDHQPIKTNNPPITSVLMALFSGDPK